MYWVLIRNIGSSTTSTSTCCCAGGAVVSKDGAVVAGIGYGGANIVDAGGIVGNNVNGHDSDNDEEYTKGTNAVANDNDK